jgi:hypothetical protein
MTAKSIKQGKNNDNIAWEMHQQRGRFRILGCKTAKLSNQKSPIANSSLPFPNAPGSVIIIV